MGQILHGSATTTEAIRRAIQHSQESLRTLAGAMASTRRPSPNGSSAPPSPICQPDPKSPDPRSSRSGTRPSSLPSASTRCCPSTTASMLCRRAIPHLTRSSLHRCLQRHGIWRLPEIEGEQAGQEKPSRHIRSATSTSTSPKFEPRKASSTCSSPSTAPASSPSSSWSIAPRASRRQPSCKPWSRPCPTRSIRC